jgi:hypothetical protein
MKDVCPLCSHPDKEEFERAVLKREMTKRELADLIGCDPQVVWEHFKEHSAPHALLALDEKRDVLTNSIAKLQDFANRVYEANTVDRSTVQQLTLLLGEMRQAVKALQELEEGKKKEAHITIEQYNDFRSLIVTKVMTTYPKLCPECQKLWADMMNSLEEGRNEQPTIIETTGRVKSV